MQLGYFEDLDSVFDLYRLLTWTFDLTRMASHTHTSSLVPFIVNSCVEEGPTNAQRLPNIPL